MNIKFPFEFDDVGCTAESDDHIREMIEQVLFTNPGERMNRPEFGCGIMQLVFEPAGEALAKSFASMADANLNQILGDRVDFDPIIIERDEEALRVNVSYKIRSTQEQGRAVFERSISLP